jgi:Cytochrome C oxidase, cbb3-type, subunit III
MNIRKVVIPAFALLVIGSAQAQQNQKFYPDTARFNNLNKEELFSRGERLTLATCGSCHFGNDGRLSGKLMEDVPKVFGTVYSANITNDKTFGIGDWSSGQLAYFIRTGIKPDGKRANLGMPRFPNIGDPELESIIAFLKSDSSASKASELPEPKTKIKLAGKLATKMVLDNYDYPKAPRQTTDTTFLIGYGDYLVNDVLHCFACHSANIARIDVKNPTRSKGYLGGGSKLIGMNGEKIISPNITFDIATGLGTYTEQQFLDVMKMGRKSSGDWIKPPMQPYTSLSDNDIRAIYEYLKVVPVINNKKLVTTRSTK